MLMISFVLYNLLLFWIFMHAYLYNFSSGLPIFCLVSFFFLISFCLFCCMFVVIYSPTFFHFYSSNLSSIHVRFLFVHFLSSVCSFPILCLFISYHVSSFAHTKHTQSSRHPKPSPTTSSSRWLRDSPTRLHPNPTLRGAPLIHRGVAFPGVQTLTPSISPPPPRHHSRPLPQIPPLMLQGLELWTDIDGWSRVHQILVLVSIISKVIFSSDFFRINTSNYMYMPDTNLLSFYQIFVSNIFLHGKISATSSNNFKHVKIRLRLAVLLWNQPCLAKAKHDWFLLIF